MENPPPLIFFKGDLKDVDSAEIWAHRENEKFHRLFVENF